MKWILTILVLFGLTQNIFACSPDGKDGFMPENDMNIPVGLHRADEVMSEQEFNTIIDKIENHYSPIVKNMGAKLKIKRNWKSGTVNAFAQQQWWFGKIYKVTMFGGLARHPEINNDGFALVVCHELGHHIGGAPKKGGWASNEGQSDYFASLKCFRNVYENDNNVDIVAQMNVDPIAQSSCEAQWSDANDQAICIRAAMGGQALSRVLGGGKVQTAFDTPNTTIVSSTNHAHPQAQCRLDTYYQGALCTIDHSVDVNQKSAVEGMCNRVDGDTIGVRPLCWYKPEN